MCMLAVQSLGTSDTHRDSSQGLPKNTICWEAEKKERETPDPQGPIDDAELSEALPIHKPWPEWVKAGGKGPGQSKEGLNHMHSLDDLGPPHPVWSSLFDLDGYFSATGVLLQSHRRRIKTEQNSPALKTRATSQKTKWSIRQWCNLSSSLFFPLPEFYNTGLIGRD